MAGEVVTRLQGRVAVMTVSNPGQRNALTPEMLRQARSALEELEAGGEARVVVLRGEGDAFSGGYALDRFPDPADLPEKDDIENLCQAIERSPLVVIAMITGPAVGAALDVACACDLRLATAGAKLGITPAKLGIVYTWRGTARVLRLAGRDWARRLFYTGELVSGAQAAEIGLVMSAHSTAEELEEATLRLADTIAARAPLSLAGAKRIFAELDRLAEVDPETARQLHGLRRRALESEDAAEARAAMAERREPRFSGR